MRFAALLISGVLLTVSALAQSRHKVDINAETPEGQALQTIGQEQDDAKKLALMEEFVAKYPSNPNLIWVYGQMQPRYLKTNQFDKIFPITEKLMAADPADSQMAHGALKAAEGKNDVDAVIRWAAATNEAGKKAAQLPKPSDEDEAEAWKHNVDFGAQVQKYAEYSHYATSLKAPDAAGKVRLMEALLKLNPKSEYIPKVEEQAFLASRAANDNAKAIEIAEGAIGRGTANEDMMLAAANSAFEKKDAARTVELATKLTEYLKNKNAPEGMDAATWENKKKVSLGAGYWMAGMTHAQANKWTETDAALREGLPFLEGNEQLLTSALFQLGLANFRLGDNKRSPNMQRLADALTYSQRCAGIKSQFQAAAQRNVAAIKAQYPNAGAPAAAAPKKAGAKKK